MRYFPLLDFQHAVSALLLGLVAVILAWVAWGSYGRRDPAEPEQPGDGVVPETGHHPVPPILVFVYAAVGAGAVGYAVSVWVSGAPVGY